MLWRMKNTLLAASAALALALSGCAATDPSATPTESTTTTPALEKIVFAGLAMDENPDVSTRYQLLMDLISEETGLPVEFYEAPDVAAIVEGLTSGRAQLAQLDGISYALATSLSEDVSLVAAYSRGADAAPGAKSYGITRVDSGIDDITDAKGLTVCFPDPASTSYLWPAYALQQAGINPDSAGAGDITPVFTGTPAQIGVAVQNGDCDLGFLIDTFWDRIYPTSDLVDMDQLTKVWESDVIPVGPLAAHSSLSSELQQQIRDLLLEKGNKDYFIAEGLCADAASCPMLAVSSWGYVATEDEFFDSVRQVCDALALEQC